MVNAAVLTLLLHAFISNASLTELISQPFILRVFFVLFCLSILLVYLLACFVFVLCSTAQADFKLYAVFLHFLPSIGIIGLNRQAQLSCVDFLPCSITHIISSSQQLMQGSAHLVLQWREELWEGPALAVTFSLRRPWWCSWSVAGTIQCWRCLWRPGHPYYFLTGQRDTPLGFVSRLSFSKASKHCNLRHFLINCKTPRRSPKSLVKCQAS